ncbi:MAG: hypothetical protein WCK89_17100, partial [bacterium]
KPPLAGDLQTNPSQQPLDLFDEQDEKTGNRGLWDLTLLQSASDCGTLNMEALPDRTLRFSWAAPSDCLLESVTNLLDRLLWRQVPGPVVIVDGQHVLSLTPTNRVELFHLRGER